MDYGEAPINTVGSPRYGHVLSTEISRSESGLLPYLEYATRV